VACIKRRQRDDGSWYGSWGVCFTYGAFFAVEALNAAGVPRADPVYAKAAQFLLAKQRDDRGWGEDFNGCVTGQWRENPDGSQVVNTAWAVISLCGCGVHATQFLEPIRRGVRFILSRQLATGDWAQERISGVFNGNAAIHYPSYITT